MRWFVIIGLGLFRTAPAAAQTLSAHSGLLAGLHASRNTDANVRAALAARYPVFTRNGVACVRASLEVGEHPDWEALRHLGVETRHRVGNFYGAVVPLHSLSALNDVAGLIGVHVDEYAYPVMDSSRKHIGAEKVWAGEKMTRGFTGRGVLVGVVDGGYDYTHPVFKDSLGRLRILRVWEHKNDAGPRPVGFDYGTEIVGEEEILAKRYDEPTSHGIHVAGIAAGSGYGTDGRYAGVAPHADLMLVSTNFTYESIIDGIQYVFDYADSEGLPAVVNLSIGGQGGPHDGTSAFDRTTEQMVRTRRILVGAAGNSGWGPTHFQHAFPNAQPDTIRTFVGANHGENGGGWTYIDSWGGPEKNFQLDFDIYHKQTGQKLRSWNYFASTLNYEYNETFVVVPGTEDTFRVAVQSVIFPVNHNRRPQIIIQIVNPNLEKYQTALVYVSQTPQTIHAWAGGQQFFDHILGQSLSGFKNGDNQYTINEIGGTGKKIISVGAYTSKNRYVNLYGEERTIDSSVFTEVGALAPFTSRGPTLDGRVKPDVTAPGSNVVSAVNSFAALDSAISTFRHDEGWAYSAFWGTSMAAPHVTGIVALMLEAQPGIHPDTLKHRLTSTAVQDLFTGTLPNGSPDWGWGKANAWNLLRVSHGIPDTVPNDTVPNDTVPNDTVPNDTVPNDTVSRGEWKYAGIRLFPNPVHQTLTVVFPPAIYGQETRVRWIDGRGLTVRQTILGAANDVQWDVRDIPPGLYVIEFSGPGGRHWAKIHKR
jgi:subtilisin family serine protease